MELESELFEYLTQCQQQINTEIIKKIKEIMTKYSHTKYINNYRVMNLLIVCDFIIIAHNYRDLIAIIYKNRRVSINRHVLCYDMVDERLIIGLHNYFNTGFLTVRNWLFNFDGHKNCTIDWIFASVKCKSAK